MNLSPQNSVFRNLFQAPVTQVVTGAFMISFSGVWVTIAAVPPTTSAFYRTFLGFLFLFIAALTTGEPRRLRPRQVWFTFFCGLTFALDLYVWHVSILHVGPGLATILGNFQVFLMAACGFLFFGEKLRLRFLLSLPLAVFGLFLVIGLHWQLLSASYRVGVYYGLLTALCYTVFLLLLRNIQVRDSAEHRFVPLMLISLFTAAPLAADIGFSGGSFAIPTLGGGLALLALGLFSQAVGWLLIASAMPKIRASQTGLLLLLQPSLAFVWDVLFFSRPTSPIQWLGVSLTLWAIYLGITGSRERNPR